MKNYIKIDKTKIELTDEQVKKNNPTKSNRKTRTRRPQFQS
jgi:hypothetical protein